MTVKDDWFSLLTVLARESGVHRDISTDENIDIFAHCSSRLREQAKIISFKVSTSGVFFSGVIYL